MIEIQASIISHSSILRKLNSGLLKVGVFFALFFALVTSLRLHRCSLGLAT
jgi:hypothetical protein